jgi:hypothetical protein
MSSAPDDLRLTPERATELAEVAAALGIAPSELLDRAVRRELASALLEDVYRGTDGLDADNALSLVYTEKEAARNPA